MTAMAMYRAKRDFGEDSPEFNKAVLAVLEKSLDEAYDARERGMSAAHSLTIQIAACKRMIVQSYADRDARFSREMEQARQLTAWKQDVESRAALCGF